MVNKYSKHLERRDTNVNTGEVWAIQDVPNTWRVKTEAKVIFQYYLKTSQICLKNYNIHI